MILGNLIGSNLPYFAAGRPISMLVVSEILWVRLIKNRGIRIILRSSGRMEPVSYEQLVTFGYG